ncbi:MAG: hypothetical protein LBE89_01360 [Helicobacteraceae bacterium]|jgi:hypothetical protein|nr:hypothetical protein [Helicobacteraceae bacterium]
MNIIFPDWYDSQLESECESKGSVLNFEVIAGSHKRSFNFYDITRFTQDAKDEIRQFGYFVDDKAIIIEKVTRKNIEKYLATLSWD